LPFTQLQRTSARVPPGTFHLYELVPIIKVDPSPSHGGKCKKVLCDDDPVTSSPPCISLDYTDSVNHQAELTDKEILAQAEPHIAKYKGTTVVIKYGGHAMENEELKAKFASDIVLLKQV